MGASRRHELSSTNIQDLSEGSCQLAELLKVNLLSGMDKVDLRREINVTGLEMKTTAEKNAEQLLMSPNLMMSQDAACSALVGAVRMFMPNSSAHGNNTGIVNMACCAHCSGEVKQV